MQWKKIEILELDQRNSEQTSREKWFFRGKRKNKPLKGGNSVARKKNRHPEKLINKTKTE